MIASENLVYDKGENISFFQILISFCIQSEVMSLSVYFLIFFSKLIKNFFDLNVSKSDFNSKGMSTSHPLHSSTSMQPIWWIVCGAWRELS